MDYQPRIVVIGLGYVGLPLALALSKNFPVVGFDIDLKRISELRGDLDRTGETGTEELAASPIKLTADAEECRAADIYIVTVPTPVDSARRPDLSAVLSATRMVAGLIDPARRPTVVYESTVYPGVTEKICGPEIERCSAFKQTRDFRLGYSPERINPGDHEHSVDRIVKVIAGEDDEVTDQMAAIYGSITSAGVFRAASIQVAEAAKAIENAQRDINIAFMNEAAQIFSKINISMWDVLAAAKTKWNFLPFEPGLVGGHCIGVDPYYLSHLAEVLGHNPRVILAGRETNDGMGAWIADTLHARRRKAGTALVMGLTFKENVSDLRNSRTFDLIRRLEWLGHQVTIGDPLADLVQIQAEHGLKPFEAGERFDLVIAAVAHEPYRAFTDEQIAELIAPGGTLADLKGIWRERQLGRDIDRWTI